MTFRSNLVVGRIVEALTRLAQACLFAAFISGHEELPAAAAEGDEADEPVVAGQEGEDSPAPTTGTPPPEGSAGAALLAEVNRELSVMKSSAYSHRTHVDEASGLFDYDCSGLLNYALGRASPDALLAVRATTTRRPRSAEFVAFLEGIPAGGRRGRWQRVARVQELSAGDVIVWLKPVGPHSTNPGHTMMVPGAPTPDREQSDAFVVPVVDSTGLAHGSSDARANEHRTGLGQGMIVLLTDRAGAPIGYRWSLEKKSPDKMTRIAFGRLH